MRWTVATLCLIAGIHAVAAQPAPASGDPAPSGPAVAAEPAAPAVDPGTDPRADAAWQLYHDLFTALMRGEQTRARDLASTLLRDHPDHPATRLVRGSQLGAGPGASGPGEDRDGGDGRETASRGARAELAAFQTLHGIALGAEICIAAECDSGGAVFGLTLGGGAVGAAISLSVLPDLTSGQRALLNSGTAWGAVNAGLLLIATQPDAQTAGLSLMAGQGAGLFAGGVLFALHPTAGQVGLANSGGQWAGVLTGLVLAASRSGADEREVSLALLAAVDAGIAGGAYLASRWPGVSRAQTLVIDAGGIVGAVGGGSLGVVISGNFSDRTTPALAAVGAVIGLGASAYLTRNWSEGSASSLHTFIAPPERGRGGVAGISARW